MVYRPVREGIVIVYQQDFGDPLNGTKPSIMKQIFGGTRLRLLGDLGDLGSMAKAKIISKMIADRFSSHYLDSLSKKYSDYFTFSIESTIDSVNYDRDYGALVRITAMFSNKITAVDGAKYYSAYDEVRRVVDKVFNTYRFYIQSHEGYCTVGECFTYGYSSREIKYLKECKANNALIQRVLENYLSVINDFPFHLERTYIGMDTPKDSTLYFYYLNDVKGNVLWNDICSDITYFKGKTKYVICKR